MTVLRRLMSLHGSFTSWDGSQVFLLYFNSMSEKPWLKRQCSPSEMRKNTLLIPTKHLHPMTDPYFDLNCKLVFSVWSLTDLTSHHESGRALIETQLTCFVFQKTWPKNHQFHSRIPVLIYKEIVQLLIGSLFKLWSTS